SHVTGINPGLDGVSPANWCLCDQNELEPILYEAARKEGGELHFGCELLSFDQDSDGLYATLRYGEGEVRQVTCSYLVAADGARSPVRTKLGIGQRGPGSLGHYVSIYFRADLRRAMGNRRFLLCYVVNHDVMGVLLPVNNTDRWLLHVPFDP